MESEYGKGTRFFVTLCLAKAGPASEQAADEETQDAAPLPALRVLLAEDNELNRQIAAEMLELLGARVELAGDGAQAVEAVRAHPPLYYDIVFMDIQMPVMNGYEAAKQIRESGMERIAELPIIAMTADAFAEDVKRARLSGMDGHLAKPITIDQLRRALSRCAAWKERNQTGSAEEC